MEIKVTKAPTFTEVKLKGDLSAETTHLVEEKVAPNIQDNCRIVLDMTGVGFMSSAGLRLLLVFRRQVPPSGRLVLLGLSEEILNTLTVTGFVEFFRIAGTVKEAADLLYR